MVWWLAPLIPLIAHRADVQRLIHKKDDTTFFWFLPVLFSPFPSGLLSDSLTAFMENDCHEPWFYSLPLASRFKFFFAGR